MAPLQGPMPVKRVAATHVTCFEMLHGLRSGSHFAKIAALSVHEVT